MKKALLIAGIGLYSLFANAQWKSEYTFTELIRHAQDKYIEQDFDGDGIEDLATATMKRGDRATTRWYIAHGNKNGTYSKPEELFSVENTYSSQMNIKAADYNGDGLVDFRILYMKKSDDVLEQKKLYNNGDRTFTAESEYKSK